MRIKGKTKVLQASTTLEDYFRLYPPPYPNSPVRFIDHQVTPNGFVEGKIDMGQLEEELLQPCLFLNQLNLYPFFRYIFYVQFSHDGTIP